MDDTITIRTSDDPPVEFKVARFVLAANSKVFGDMLSIPSGSSTAQDAKFDLAETQRELEPFLRVLNISHDQGNPLEELKDGDWPVVARLADKYDSVTVRALVLCMCWSWSTPADTATGGKHCKPGFDTAVELKHPHFAKVFMLRAIKKFGGVDLHQWLESRSLQSHFEKWNKLLKAHAAMCALDATGVNLCYSCAAEDPSLADTTWLRMMRAVMHDWDPYTAATPFNGPVWGIGQQLHVAQKICQPCKIAFDRFANSLDEHFRNTAPDFPL